MKKCVIIFTEGETEEVFYNRLLNEIKIKTSTSKFYIDKLEKICLKGISKFDKKLINIYKNDLSKKYHNYEIVVFLCYDSDVFDFSTKPPVDWNYIEKNLYELGASKVYHIKAKTCIEDLFLIDINGICDFLKIDVPRNVRGRNAVEKLNYLFYKGKRIYQKGYSTKGFIESLDISLILNKKYEMFENLVYELTYKSKVGSK